MSSEKEKALYRMRRVYARGGYRIRELLPRVSREEAIELLADEGEFEDLREILREYRRRRYHRSRTVSRQREVSDLIEEALNRLWLILREGCPEDRKESLFRGIILYGEYELARGEVDAGRFHTSCFAIPSAAVGLYFLLFPDMEKAERGEGADPLLREVNRVLKELGYQAWTQPFRRDATDDNLISIARFRKHVWWVGGNGLAYRPVFQSAVMLNSVPMMDLLAEVALKGLSAVSHTTYDEAFWIEGMTADGAGWGHGRQCLIWGYPIHGTAAALWILASLQNTPWEQSLTEEGKAVLFNFLRGSAFFHYRGFIPPALDRSNMIYAGRRAVIPAEELAQKMQDDFGCQFSEEEREELTRYRKEAAEYRLLMKDSPPGHYHGVRYFYDNDTLVKKTPSYYLMINMASRRCDGLESADTMTSGYNFYACDGLTFFISEGNEYNRALGGWDLTSWPGVTARQGEETLRSIQNWRGFCSHYPFAGGAGSSEGNGCAGFMFRKYNASRKKGTNDRAGLDERNEIIYGVKAHKGYFIFGDVFLALGAGIENERPDLEGDITTTLDQTVLGEVHVDGVRIPFKGDRVARNIPAGTTVSNGNFAYRILDGAGELVLARRKTRWDDLSPKNRDVVDKPGSVDLFKFSVNHGREVKDGSYAYLVGLKGSLPEEPPVILDNSKRLQAALSPDGQTLGAVFYHSQAVVKAPGLTVGTSRRCILLLEKRDGGYDLTLSDPLMDSELNRIIITINGEEIPVDLPQEPHRGKPAHITCSYQRN